MSTFEKIFTVVFLLAFLLAFIWAIRREIKKWRLFYCYDGNPFRRKCKKCGQAQANYSYPEFNSPNNWWEEIYPLGGNPNCECKKYIREDNIEKGIINFLEK